MRGVLLIGCSNHTILASLMACETAHHDVLVVDRVERFHRPAESIEDKVAKLVLQSPSITSYNKQIPVEEFRGPSRPFYRGLRKYRRWDQ